MFCSVWFFNSFVRTEENGAKIEIEQRCQHFSCLILLSKVIENVNSLLKEKKILVKTLIRPNNNTILKQKRENKAGMLKLK